MKRRVLKMKHLEQVERRSFGAGTGRNGALDRSRLILVAIALTLAACLAARAQVNSGSTGSDGALDFSTITNATNIIIDVHDHPTGIYQYTYVNIPSTVTVSFIPNAKNTPVTWLVQSNVVINGIVDVSGQSGSASGAGGNGGPGGYRGGNASNADSAGQGPGGGNANGSTYGFAEGSFASYGSLGPTYSLGYGSATISPGSIYGNSFLIPLLGGSGGGGAIDRSSYFYGGGGGGGAILIAASMQIQLNGAVIAKGGSAPGGDYAHVGGTGSGGAVRLICNNITGSGTIDVSGGVVVYSGYNYTLQGGSGRVRLDILEDNFAGQINGVLTQGFQPIIIPVPGQGVQLSIASVGGASVSATPSGQLVSPDAVISGQQSNPIPIVVNCSNLPLNTPVTVTVTPASGSPVSAAGYNSTGTLISSTATVSLVIPRGGGIIYATAAAGN